MIYVIFCGPVARLYYAGVTEDYGVGGDVHVYVAVGGDQDVVTDGDFAYDGGVDAYPDLVPYRRGAFVGTSVRLADDDTFVDVAVSANAGLGVNGDVIVMAYI
jgi:hypothetical protein